MEFLKDVSTLSPNWRMHQGQLDNGVSGLHTGHRGGRVPLRGDLMLISLTLEQPVPNHSDWNQVYR